MSHDDEMDDAVLAGAARMYGDMVEFMVGRGVSRFGVEETRTIIEAKFSAIEKLFADPSAVKRAKAAMDELDDVAKRISE